MVDHDMDTLSYMLEGTQINDRDNAIITTYNDKNQITKISQGTKEVNYTYNSQNLLSEIIQGNKTYKLNYDNFLNTGFITWHMDSSFTSIRIG